MSLQTALQTAAVEFDTRYSRFRDDSLVAQLARDGRLLLPPAEMINMLKYAKQLFYESDGVFNITVGGALHALGYGAREHAASVIADPWREISWQDTQITAPKGLLIDFGGFGKGWLIETFAAVMRTHGVRYFIVNGGGDIYVDAPETIEFALEHPYDPTKSIGQTHIKKGALAASSTVKRVWELDSKQYHHIIDPATERSSDSSIVASFVRADSALIADTVATIIILRPELAEVFEKRYGVRTITV